MTVAFFRRSRAEWDVLGEDWVFHVQVRKLLVCDEEL